MTGAAGQGSARWSQIRPADIWIETGLTFGVVIVNAKCRGAAIWEDEDLRSGSAFRHKISRNYLHAHSAPAHLHVDLLECFAAMPGRQRDGARDP